MANNSVRLPLTEQVEPRLSGIDKDGLASNIFYDKDESSQYAVKRPGITSYIAGSGTANGIYKNSIFYTDLNYDWVSIIWNGTTFVTVPGIPFLANGSTLYDLSGKSSDGTTWTFSSVSPLSLAIGNLTDLVWTGSVFCCIALNGEIYTSSTGTNWNRVGTISSANCDSIAYGNELVVVGRDTNNYAVAKRSTDSGVTWTSTTFLSSSSSYSSVAWNSTASLYCTVNGTSSNIAYTSPTGATWTARTLPATSSRWCIAASSTLFVSPRYNSSSVDYSSDGIVWNTATLPSSKGWAICEYINDRFIVSDGYVIAYSTDAINWTQKTLPVINGEFGQLYYSAIGGNTNIMIALSSGNSYAYSLDDGSTWTSGTLGIYMPSAR